MRRVRCLSLMVALAVLLPAAGARAETITVLRAFSANVFDQIGVVPFDPALGTLDSVDVNISGLLTVTGIALQSGFFGPGGVFSPVPYAYSIDVTQNFFGLAGGYFTFNEPGRFRIDGQATGFQENFLFLANYTYAFQFNAFTELLGGVPVVVPATSAGIALPLTSGVSGSLSDFASTALPIHEIDMVLSTSAGSLGGPVPLISDWNTQGVLELRYNYTPTSAPPPAPVSEPASLLLFGTGALGLLASGCRRRNNR
jgi:hypothetical protein